MDGIAPTICACTHGYAIGYIAEVEKMEEKRLGNVFGDDKGTGYAGNVWDTNGLSPAMTTMQGGCRQPMVIDAEKVERTIVAERGRDKTNPSHRGKTNENYEQRLEPREDGCTNCITTVGKDNLVLERTCLRMVRTEEGKKLRKQYENHEIKHGFNEYREAELKTDGCSNTITTVQKDNLILEKLNIIQATKKGYTECEVGGGGRFELSNIGNKKRTGDRGRENMPDSDDGG